MQVGERRPGKLFERGTPEAEIALTARDFSIFEDLSVCRLITTPQLQALEPTLVRNGYDAPALTVLLRAKPAEVRDFLAGTLAADRTREFTEQLRVAGVPV